MSPGGGSGLARRRSSGTGRSRLSSWLVGRGSVDDISPVIVPGRITARGGRKPGPDAQASVELSERVGEAGKVVLAWHLSAYQRIYAGTQRRR